MGLIKTGLIIGGIVLGLGAVGGISAGVISSQKQSSETIISQDEPDNKPTEDIQNNQPNETSHFQTIARNIDSVLNSISESDIAIKDKATQIKLNEEYAFNLNNRDLEIIDTSKSKVPQGYRLDISIDKKNNSSIKALNNGEITIDLKVTNEISKETKTKKLKITTFKKADESLLALLDEEIADQQATQNSSLSIIPTKQNAAKFISIEKLNETSNSQDQNEQQMNGITSWFHLSEKGNEQKQVSIEGKVRVSEINKGENETTIFTLKPASNLNYLKLVKTDNKNQKTEAIFSEIKTTNLLASKLVIKPSNYESELSKEFKNTLSEKTQGDNSTANGFKNLDNKIKLEVKKSDNELEKSEVTLEPFVLKLRPEANNSINVSLGLKVSFGTGIDEFSLDSSISNQAAILENVGFKFHFYTRLLDGIEDKTAIDLKASHLITGNHKLNEYLISNKYITPSQAPKNPNSNTPENALINHNFFVFGPYSNELNKGIKWETKMWEEKTKRNYIVFADYSYLSAKTEDGMYELKEKVLYTPNLSFLNIQKTIEA